jgi:hypothetical protein
MVIALQQALKIKVKQYNIAVIAYCLMPNHYKAIHIDNKKYLIHLCGYIHRNALEAGLVQRIELWKYANYLEWIEVRRGTLSESRTFGTLLDLLDYSRQQLDKRILHIVRYFRDLEV